MNTLIQQALIASEREDKEVRLAIGQLSDEDLMLACSTRYKLDASPCQLVDGRLRLEFAQRTASNFERTGMTIPIKRMVTVELSRQRIIELLAAVGIVAGNNVEMIYRDPNFGDNGFTGTVTAENIVTISWEE